MHLSLYDVLLCVTCLCIQKTSVALLCYFLFLFLFSFYSRWSCVVVSSGWQPRWFVLDSGVISYYDSEDDVGKGSKGSIKMSVCDIKG